MKKKVKKVHCPGIEPGSQEWESCMIPLHQQCLLAAEVETAGVELAAVPYLVRLGLQLVEPGPQLPGNERLCWSHSSVVLLDCGPPERLSVGVVL